MPSKKMPYRTFYISCGNRLRTSQGQKINKAQQKEGGWGANLIEKGSLDFGYRLNDFCFLQKLFHGAELFGERAHEKSPPPQSFPSLCIQEKNHLALNLFFEVLN